jgi:hypothetical protein
MLPPSSTLKIEVTCFSEMSVDFQWTTWHYIPEDRTLHNHCCENVKSYSYKHVSFLHQSPLGCVKTISLPKYLIMKVYGGHGEGLSTLNYGAKLNQVVRFI